MSDLTIGDWGMKLSRPAYLLLAFVAAMALVPWFVAFLSPSPLPGVILAALLLGVSAAAMYRKVLRASSRHQIAEGDDRAHSAPGQCEASFRPKPKAVGQGSQGQRGGISGHRQESAQSGPRRADAIARALINDFNGLPASTGGRS